MAVRDSCMYVSGAVHKTPPLPTTLYAGQEGSPLETDMAGLAGRAGSDMPSGGVGHTAGLAGNEWHALGGWDCCKVVVRGGVEGIGHFYSACQRMADARRQRHVSIMGPHY